MDELRRRTLLTTGTTAALSSLAGCAEFIGGTTNETDGSNANESDTANESDADDEEDLAEPETLEEAATLLLEDFTDERFDRASKRFRDDLAAPGQLEQFWTAYTAVGGSFEAVADTSETTVSGYDAVDLTLAFERGDHVLRVVANDDLEIENVAPNDEYERPSYVDPDTFEERTATLEAETCLLEGVVTTPADANADGDVPGVVIVHGSGPVDRNLDAGGTRLYQDVAEGLASTGIATLRYDKRTLSCRVRPEEYTLDTVTVDDALLAVEKLRNADGVDPDRIVVLGHSLGGLAAPRIAERDGNLAGAVGFAAPARSFYELSLDQVEYQATFGEFDWEEMTTTYEDWSDRVERVRNGDYNPSDTILGYPGAFWDSLDDYDQVETARSIDTPLLFQQGDRDFRVTAEDDFDRWRTALEGREGTAFERYDGLNHLFMPGEGPPVEFEHQLRNNLDESVLEDLVAWIDEL